MPAAVQASFSPRLLLIGLEERLALDLTRHLPNCKWTACSEDGWRKKLASTDLIFCHAGSAALPGILDLATAISIPVIVVTKHPDISEWLNAMDAGAADYTAPPFDRKQMEWMLATNLRAYGATISVNSRASTAPQA